MQNALPTAPTPQSTGQYPQYYAPVAAVITKPPPQAPPTGQANGNAGYQNIPYGHNNTIAEAEEIANTVGAEAEADITSRGISRVINRAANSKDVTIALTQTISLTNVSLNGSTTHSARQPPHALQINSHRVTQLALLQESTQLQ